MQRSCKNSKYGNKQGGMATIIAATTMLLLITMVILTSSNTGVMETKINANEYRAAQAFLAAQAGIDYTLSSLSRYDLDNPVAPLSTINATTMQIAKTALQHDDSGKTVITGYYTVTIDKTDPDVMQITSDGLSADEDASAKIEQSLSFANPLRDDAANFIIAPIITSGNLNIDANKITQGAYPVKIYTGGILSGNNIPGTTLNKLVDKILDQDAALGVLDFWNGVFGSNQTQIKHMSFKKDCTSGCSNPTSMTSNSGLSRIHFAEKGNLTLNNVTVGSQNYPAIVVVDLTSGGSFSLRNNATINGVLYVIGNWNNNNYTGTVNGSVIIDGTLTNGTNLTVAYNNNVSTNIVNTGVYTRVPGRWSDVN